MLRSYENEYPNTTKNFQREELKDIEKFSTDVNKISNFTKKSLDDYPKIELPKISNLSNYSSRHLNIASNSKASMNFKDFNTYLPK